MQSAGVAAGTEWGYNGEKAGRWGPERRESGMEDTILLHTGCGDARGLRRQDCRAFLGVPYARAERFGYAEQVEHWEGTLDATRFGPSCPQNRAWHEHLEHPTRRFFKKEFREGLTFTYDEDCLNVNIFTPHDAAACPVVVFFHGGGFDSGMNCEAPFDGGALAARGIVTVFANYRVGVLGYLTHREIQAKYGRDGNFGLDDQLTAIRWVKDHIADFGGDGDNITIMGQSAGAISVQYLCLNENNRGLFRRAVMMSGAGLFPRFALPRRAEDTHGYWEEFMALAGCGTLDGLRQASLDTLFDAVEAIKQRRKDNTYHNMPVVDGVLLPEGVDKLMAHPLPMDYMVGCTAGDMYAPIMARIGSRFARQTGGYLYYFDIPAPGDDNGAFHSADLYYVFETLDRCWRPYGARDYQAAGQMADYIANFARCGDPNGSGLPRWDKAGRGKCALRIAPEGTAMGRPDYLQMTRHFLTKGEPKA